MFACMSMKLLTWYTFVIYENLLHTIEISSHQLIQIYYQPSKIHCNAYHRPYPPTSES